MTYGTAVKCLESVQGGSADVVVMGKGGSKEYLKRWNA